MGRLKYIKYEIKKRVIINRSCCNENTGLKRSAIQVDFQSQYEREIACLKPYSGKIKKYCQIESTVSCKKYCCQIQRFCLLD